MVVESAGGGGKDFFQVAFGDAFESAVGFENTTDRIVDASEFSREDIPPEVIQPWECRIGGCRFFVPPVNINVEQRYKTGSMTGSAIRQQTSPKFNSGHTDTVVSMTLYFPTMESVFGAEDTIFDIDFDEDGNESRIDRFLSSLRGLIAQFRYAPFLPIRNDYLNRVFDITGVALKDMTISTVPNFPFCMAVTLVMYKFNHKVYLPMINHFDQAVHWGRFRSYMGRAAIRLAQSAKPMKVWTEAMGANIDPGKVDVPVKTADEILRNSDQNYSQGGEFSFRQPELIGEDPRYKGAHTDASLFEFFYPFQTPTRLDIPDIDDLRPPPDPEVTERKRAFWERLLEVVGINVDAYPESEYSEVRKIAEEQGTGYYDNSEEDKLLYNYLKRMNIAHEEMGSKDLEEYIAFRLREENITPGTGAAREMRVRITRLWMYALMRYMLESPALANALANEESRNRQITFDEWEIPLKRLELDWRAVDVQGVGVTMGNRLAPLQLQLQGESTHQHIGGEDTRIEISLMINGPQAESQLVKLRNMFDAISGLARLEHGHGVLGFLGIKNVITELMGIRYVVPLDFNVSTVPSHPHAYNVEITLVDFDIFQQRREQMTAEQQAELVDAFGKRNPFLRIKQLWGAFNAYPDFPLAVRDDEGKIVGHLEPDFYFRGFKPIDDDLVTVDKYDKVRTKQIQESKPKTKIDDFEVKKKKKEDASSGYDNILDQPGQHINFGTVDGKPQVATVNDEGVTLHSGDEVVAKDVTYQEMHGGVIEESYVDGLTPPSGHIEPYFGGSSDPRYQFEAMAKDMQYRDKSGRMVRAFPTYMMWLIDEAGNFGSTKLFDNFYGLQSVIDMSIVRSEDIMADTLVLRLSNLYSKLSTNFTSYLEENDPAARIINEFTTRSLRLLTGASEYMVKLDTIRLKPGVRLHLRLGYGSNPNALETVFNGTITEVQQGDVITIVAQSDAVELGAEVNNTNKDGHSGRIDGNMTGLYMSEPRDLMLALLTKGSSITREVIAHATKGEIFSENRYGIKHFGYIQYTHMGARERDKDERRKETLSSRVMEGAEDGDGLIKQFFDVAMITILNDAWVNLATHRDYELFKRNIYPGNGLGVSQFLGGDMGDVFELGAHKDQPGRGDPSRGNADGVADGVGFSPGGESHATDPLTGKKIKVDSTKAVDTVSDSYAKDRDPRYTDNPEGDALEGDPYAEQWRERWGEHSGLAGPPNPTHEGLKGNDKPGNVFGYVFKGRWLDDFNITSRYDDDVVPEVSFRAQTYMKTVWDMFKICAALQPDYIVAVRPFEDRSTVFYGKPHWLYTSGVIPLSKGAKPEDMPELEGTNEELQQIFNKMEARASQRDELFKEDLLGAVKATSRNPQGPSDPTRTNAGMEFDGSKDSILNLPTSLPGGKQIPHSEGATGIEMHLPTSGDLQTDISQHQQLEDLPENIRHPFYMDRGGSDVGKKGGYVGTNKYDPSRNPFQQTILKGENPDNPGKPGAAGFLDPEVEQWYCNQRWTGAGGGASGWLKVWRGKKILIYCPKTNRAVVCTPGEYGPAKSVVQNHGVVSGVSPDAYYALGEPSRNDNCYYRVLPDDYPLGPINNIGGAASSSGMGKYEDSTSGYDNAIQGQKDIQSVKSSDVPSGSEVKMTTGKKELPSWMDGRGNKDIDKIAFEEGWKVAGIPVNYTKSEKTEGIEVTEEGVPVDSGTSSDNVYIYYDEVGEQAKQAYLHNRSEEEANQIWDDMRNHFPSDTQTIDIFNKWVESADVEIENKDELRKNVINNFLKYMWQRPHARGWVVKVAHKKTDISQSVIPGPWDPDIPGSRDWDISPIYEAFRAFLEGNNVSDPNRESETLESWMSENQKDGYDQEGYIQKGIEKVGKVAHDALGKIGKIANALITTAGGLLSYLRMSLMQTTHGMFLADDMARNANLLNGVYNDSIYYSAGVKDGKVENPLLFYADNPFTREYGEPVAEVREPFQRMHTINSIRHILSNNISENLGDVATVITAVSNNADPVTVHFDKGIPPERQVERTVETGLFYDDPGVWGFLPNKWLEQQREWDQKGFLGLPFPQGGQGVSPPELNAKRVALWHLKENLKDIYQGEITVIGDPSIRPYDLVYMADFYESTHGFFEVEQVVHHFTPETGFVTSITPNACVTINDPGRLYLVANWQRRRSVNTIRDRLREALEVRADNESGEKGHLDLDILQDQLGDELTNTVQYFGGTKALLTTLGILSIPTLGVGGFLGWQVWQWTRDNLLDQHGCFINYLTKNGRPMDAGLSYNQGTAVGHQRSIGIMLAGLKIGEIGLVDEDGSKKIRTSDVIPALQWDEYGPNEYAREVDMFVDSTLAEIRKQTGRDGSLIAGDNGVEVYWVRVTNVVDVDTFNIQMIEHFQFGRSASSADFSLGDTIRLAGAQGLEDPNKNDEVLSQMYIDNIGTQATNYAKQKLEGSTVALRVNKARMQETGSSWTPRTLAYVFHNAPNDITTEEGRKEYLVNAAGASIPIVGWNSYTKDGQPHTFDWEIIVRGWADTYAGDLERSLPGHGVHHNTPSVSDRDKYNIFGGGLQQ